MYFFQAQDMTAMLKDSFREMLDNVEWMSDKTKEYAKSKVSCHLGWIQSADKLELLNAYR